MLRSLILGLVLASAFAPDAQAQNTVQEMLPSCEAFLNDQRVDGSSENFLTGYCLGTISGISQVMGFNCGSSMAGTASPGEDFMAVLPPTPGAGVQAWVNWARGNPTRWGDNFSSSVVEVLRETFSCTR